MKIASESKVEVRDFSSREEDGYYIVWTASSSQFVELPRESFEALSLLNAGLSMANVSRELEEKYGAPFDISDFVSRLVDLGFVKSIDGVALPPGKRRRVSLPFVRQRHVAWIYSKPLMVLYLVLIGSALVILVYNPAYRPSYRDFFFAEDHSVNLLLSMIAVIALIFLHEFAHLIAGRSVGVDGFFTVNLRLFYPVAETNLSDLWRLRKRQRLLPFLAGILNDTLIASLILIGLWSADRGLLCTSLSLIAFGKFILLILSSGIIWQLMFFMRTDIYFVISTLTGARNLYGDAWRLIANKILRSWGKEPEPLQLSNRESRIVRIYSVFMFTGTLLSVATFGYYGIPVLIEILVESITLMTVVGSMEFVRGAISFAVVAVQLGSIMLFSVRSIRTVLEH